jgi:hypothetical protein
MKIKKLNKKLNKISLHLEDTKYSREILRLINEMMNYTDKNGKQLFSTKWLFKRLMGIDIKKYKNS